MTELKLSVDYEEFEDGKRVEDEIEQLAGSPEGAALTSLIIGEWGHSFENSSKETVEALVKHSASFPSLRKLFIGDMSSEECEISWIIQSDLSPLLSAFPELQSLTAQGGNELEFSSLEHDKLEELIIISGGLPKKVLKSIAGATLPNLRKLELYLGVEDYGFDGGLEDVLSVIPPGKFPKLTYLGLKNSELQDEIAIALSQHEVLGQLETLDLSLGTLSDKGGEALLSSSGIKGLKKLDLNYHYMTDDMVNRFQASGLPVDVSDQQDIDEEEDWRYPSITE
ncbi:STM4015 family protein [Paenibacillus sp. CAU 1782]